MPTKKLTPIELREIAIVALVDERTLRRALAGATVRHLSRERIRRELANRGLLALLPLEAR
jgi:hypothetical protein